MPATSVSVGVFAGLTDQEAQARLKAEGYNELPRHDRRTPLRIVLDVLREPMLALLLGAGFIYLLLGDLKEALILLAFGAMSVVITVVQETRTERVLEALRDLTSPRALVIRNSERRRIAGRDVVRGDLIVLAEGDRVPADASLLDAQDLEIDESLLTGESVPVRKRAVNETTADDRHAGGDDQPFVYSGSLVVRGGGVAEVIATGPRSEIGKIGQTLQSLDAEPPRLQRQTAALVRLCALGGAAVSVLAVLLYGTLRGGWLDALLAGIAIGMSMLPEEFPVVLTVFMAMGAWRISKARVLTRRAASIETLGSATVLCTDKTGTLTENRMTIAELRTPDGAALRSADAASGGIAAAFTDIAVHGVLASAAEPFDPMEKAFHAFAREMPDARDRLPDSSWRLVRGYGLRPDVLAMTQVWQRPDAAELVVASKGAPEAIARLCRLSEPQIAALRRTVDAMAASGLRVLGVAGASHENGPLPDEQTGFSFRFLGLVGLADPLRHSVPAAIADCRSAGIRVVMITGDYPATAQAIAQAAGLDMSGVLTGDELRKLDDAALADAVKTVNIFARIVPEQKLRIVQALKANGEIVAMTGDGVNDAPSLKAAHIGVAMGGRGTDVAREASSIVLLDDDFGSVVTAVRLGRRIYDNLRKAMGFIFAVHVPIAGMALLPLVLGLPIFFSPIHIAFLEMVIDPVCSLVFEAETDERDVMSRPPRKPDAPLFSWPLIAWSVLQGATAFGVIALIYIAALWRGLPEDEARALGFFSLVLTVVSLVLVNRSFSASLVSAFRRRNAMLVWILLVIAAGLAAIMLWPAAASLFRFGPLHGDDLLVTVAAAAIVLIGLEVLKPIWRARLSR
ncbi:cation-translocating P-type ATPase [Bradyrhizobium liaoningense]|uniref:cation-translocating P-type ATPase n=1 Tax=Bradyrhizobium liaoningense TaxID=43992 RepID=UPI001BA47F3C|nr:cation-translocating P-type ATPase [Bradyrhizobium liaoningense]MBR0712864.1 cation-translocating P-type ATPase [Bradyrhizobium liaoningense]